MALNLVYRGDPRKNRERVVPEGTVSGDPLLLDDGPAVALTSRSDATKSFTTPQGYTLSGVPSGGVGNATNSATVAFDGTYEFSGVVSTGETPAPTSTPQSTAVYITEGGTLTLASAENGTDNDLFGHVDYPPDYHKVAGTLPIRIGA
jgi:hypothetical protein